ncbi:MAG: CDP-alcohol phosphatidyltransferase family protein [Candidatus Syntropharchaeia archaeon]
MLAGRFRDRFQKGIAPFTEWLGRFGITPNIVTTTGLFLTIPLGYSIIKGHLFISALLIALAGFIDTLDGALAENTDSASEFGKFYDAFSDRVVEAVIYLSISVRFPDLVYPAILALALSYLASYIAAWQKEMKYIGIGSRAERMLVLIIAFFFGEIFYGLLLVSMLAGFTVIHRFYLSFSNR